MNEIIHKVASVVFFLLAGIVFSLTLRCGLLLIGVISSGIRHFNALENYQLGRLFGEGIASLIGFILLGLVSKFLFKKGKWFWEFSTQ